MDAQFRDQLAWREVVPWSPVERAMQLHAEWREAQHLSPEELKRKTRVEVRGGDGGEMRVLAALDVAT